MASLTAAIVVRDEEKLLPGCLQRLNFVNEIIVVLDDRTIDDTKLIAQREGARVIVAPFIDFSQIRNISLEAANSDWILVLDADERISHFLRNEITQCIKKDDFDAYRIQIANVFYGHLMRYGGWKERPIRLFRSHVGRFEGSLHEVLTFNIERPRVGNLSAPLYHFSHRSIIDNLTKTATYADIYAHALQKRGAEPVTRKKLFSVAIKELLYRLLVRQGWRDGMPGIIESIYQPLSLMAVQARLWELQQNPSIDELYESFEDDTW